MSTQPDITIEPGAWVNINTEAGIAAGTAARLVNKGNQTLLVALGTVAPANANTGVPLTPVTLPYGVMDVAEDSEPVWVLAQHKSCRVSFQEA